MYKLVAVDMDGTFLDDNKTYSQEKFATLMKRFNDLDVEFVVASGNQYYQLKSFFKGYDHLISYVSENGARVVKHGEEIYCASMGLDTLMATLTILNQYDCQILVCGQKQAYHLKQAPLWWHDYVAVYNHKVKKIRDFSDLQDEDDQYFKLAIQFEDDKSPKQAVKELNNKLDNNLKAVQTAVQSVDLIFQDNHKAQGIEKLLNQFNLNMEDVLAFGDNGNDLEMIEAAGKGVVVSNAIDELKEIADEIIGSSSSGSVLNYLLDVYKV